MLPMRVQHSEAIAPFIFVLNLASYEHQIRHLLQAGFLPRKSMDGGFDWRIAQEVYLGENAVHDRRDCTGTEIRQAGESHQASEKNLEATTGVSRIIL